MSARPFAIAVAFAVLATLPYWMPGIYYINVASQILFYAVFALGLNVLVGYAGLVSLGHAGLFGVTAYAVGYMLQLGFGHPLAILAALVIGVASMAIYAALSLRSTGIGFILITLALGEILWGLAYCWVSLTGGDNGFGVKTRPEPFGFSLSDANTFYYATLVIFLLSLVTAMVFVRSPLGAALMGTRDQPRRMRMLGYNVWLIQWLTFVMAGFWASVAGVLYVYYNLFLSPHAISLQQSAEILLMAILGGASTLTGPIVGAAIITLVKNVISTYVERWNTLLGVIFVVVIMFMPYGLVPGCTQLWRRLRNRGKTPKTASGAALASETSGQRGEVK